MNTKYSKKRINKKGFTLIELLAVIVILAILVMLAIPAVTRYLTAARQGAFADNAQKAIDAVRTEVITSGFSQSANTNCKDESNNKVVCTYSRDAFNDLLEKKLITSPFGGEIDKTSYVKVIQTYTPASGSGDSQVPAKTTYQYRMCMSDTGRNGFEELDEKEIISKNVKVGGAEKCPDQNPQQAPAGGGTGN